MRLDQLLGEQHIRSTEEWNRLIDNNIKFQPQTNPNALSLIGG